MRMKDVAEKLMAGKAVTFRPSGNSMNPRIKNKQKVTVFPRGEAVPSVGDVVFAKVRGSYLLHLVSRVTHDGFEISNNHGHVNGTVKLDKILSGKVEVHEN